MHPKRICIDSEPVWLRSIVVQEEELYGLYVWGDTTAILQYIHEEYLFFFFHNKTLFVAFSFKGQPMGAVSVFTSEELPSPTLSEILSLPFPRSCSFRDVVASLLVL